MIKERVIIMNTRNAKRVKDITGMQQISIDLKPERCEEVAKEIRELGRNAIAYAIDVTNYEQVANMYKRMVDEWGTVDFVVNSAGVCLTEDLTAQSLKDIDLSIYLRKWSNMYPHVGYGGLYKAFVLTGLAQDSRGNGAAMRVAPCAIVAKSLEETLMLAEEQCKITHTNSIAIDGAKAIAAAVFIAKNEREKGTSIADIKEKIKSYIEENFDYNLGMSLQEIQTRSMELAAQRDEFRRTGKMSSTYMNMSSASLSCPMAITAFLLGENYEEVIRCAIAMMGDVDTIACMAGSIAAQVYGIPRQLVDEAIVYLPLEMVEVLSAFEPENNIVASRVTPPEITKWKEKGEIVVYGSGDDDNEKGKYETVASRYNRYPRIGYPIPTIEKTIEEIKNIMDTNQEIDSNNAGYQKETCLGSCNIMIYGIRKISCKTYRI